jgi:DNA polymerase-3 subunit beta
MKFSSLQENLAEGLQMVFRAVPNKGPLPVLSNVYISTEGGRLKLAATDLATTIMTYVGASVEDNGATTVPAKLLRDFVNNLSPGTVDAHLKDDIFHIQSPASKSKFNSINAADFPELPEPKIEEHLLEFDPKFLQEIMSLVGFASGTDTSRPIFCGTLLKYEDDKLTIASTDGYRLSEKVVGIKSTKDSFSAVIPTKTLQEVVRIFSKAPTNIRFAFSEDENQVMFLSGDTFVSTRILDGQYPPYKQIVPTDTNLSATFPLEPFLEAVRLTSVFAASEGNNAIKIVVDPEKECIRVVSLVEEIGAHESEIPAQVEGPLTEIAFNVRYLLDFLNNIKGETLTLKTSGNIAPCVFETDTQENFIHIIMPIQI